MGSITIKEIQQKITELQKQNDKPTVVVIEGIIGSGKSYLASQIIKSFPEKTILLTMDLFFNIIRSKWKDKFENNKESLLNWYDQQKALGVLNRIIQRKKFIEKNCYNLNNGELDKDLNIDASSCKLIIFEGLLSSIILRNQFDLGILVDAPEHVALTRAEQRDKTERNMDEQKWQFKKAILHDMYIPYMDRIRQSASFVYLNDVNTS